MANCNKCGLPITFKQLNSGKWCPTNPDGSDHWDVCRTVSLAKGNKKMVDFIHGGITNPHNLAADQLYSGEAPPWD